MTRVGSVVSYTEPGPIQDTPADEFMAILERNSAIVEKALAKNREMAGKIDPKSPTSPTSSATSPTTDGQSPRKSSDGIGFTDIVDAKDVPKEADKDDNDADDPNAGDKEKSK